MISKSSRIVLWSLLVLFIASNVAAIWLGHPNPARAGRALPWLQRSTSLQLALAAWLFWSLASRRTEASRFSMLLAIGMSLSFLADLIMAGMIRLPDQVMGGIAVFGFVHAIYASASFSTGRFLNLRSPGVWMASILAWIALGLSLWILLVRNPGMPAPLNYGSLVYTLLIATMVACAVSVALSEKGMWLLAAGAILFLSSDLILGNRIFRRNPWPYVDDVVWLTYIAGQAGIVYSNLPALRICARRNAHP